MDWVQIEQVWMFVAGFDVMHLYSWKREVNFNLKRDVFLFVRRGAQAFGGLPPSVR